MSDTSAEYRFIVDSGWHPAGVVDRPLPLALVLAGLAGSLGLAALSQPIVAPIAVVFAMGLLVRWHTFVLNGKGMVGGGGGEVLVQAAFIEGVGWCGLLSVLAMAGEAGWFLAALAATVTYGLAIGRVPEKTDAQHGEASAPAGVEPS